ncbi:glycosyltransferase family 25 protein [Candidatus Nomurabacteria bacterium]|nr:glycosyltransferase family 25 protein [Candidatus Nomurabacteria bacterium]
MFTTFVINLDKDTERLTFMDAQLQMVGIEYRRQSAVLGKKYQPTPLEYDESKAIKKGGRPLLPGELGCALSHAAVLSAIVKERIAYTLVLEDDVSLPPNFKQIIEEEIYKNKAHRWDYLLFDYVAVGLPFIRQWIQGVGKTFCHTFFSTPFTAIAILLYALLKSFYVIPLSLFEGVRERYRQHYPGSVRFFRPLYFAGAYLITLKGAEKMLPLTQPIVYTADQLPNRARILSGLRLRGYAPQIVNQQKDRFGSSILDLKGHEL